MSRLHSAGYTHARDKHSPMPTLLEVLVCDAKTVVSHVERDGERCHAWARYRCKKCSRLFCTVHGKKHVDYCLVLNGRQ